MASIWKIRSKNIEKFLSIDVVSTLEDICKIYLLTPVYGNLGGKADIRGKKCYLAVTDCHPQKARVKKNLGEFPCKNVGIAYFESLLSELNPKTRFRCTVCPPDKHPNDLWCEWEVWIEK